MLRRRGRAAGAALRYPFAGHAIDSQAWTLHTRDGRREPLGERELGVLRLLTERAGEVVPRDDILDRVWGDDVFPSSRTLDALMARLRRLFERDPDRPEHLHAVRGVGYRFTPEPEPPEPGRPPPHDRQGGHS
jgi:two-component system, OmpR family, alkaline phosphatase synthesis response regulator PhoP